MTLILVAPAGIVIIGLYPKTDETTYAHLDHEICITIEFRTLKKFSDSKW